jgi:hypothetical protein
MHVVSVDGIEPITAEYALSLLAGSRRLRSETHRTVTLQLSKRKSRTRSAYEQHRASFDTLRPVLASHQAVLPVPPPPVTLIHKAYSGPFRKNYIAATIKQFEDNASLFVYGKPVLRSTLSTDAIILPSIMAPSFKKSHDLPNLYKFKVRHTLHGGKMIHGLHYNESYSPVGSHDSIKTGLALASAQRYAGIGTSDIQNCFQAIIHFADSKMHRKFATVPQYFQSWYEDRYKFSFPGPAKECVIPLFTNMQGTKDAGKLCYEFIHLVLLQYGMVRSPVDYGCYSKSYPEGVAYVLLSTDDFLGLFPRMPQFQAFCDHLSTYFKLTTSIGRVLHFLNMRITIGPHGISIDQTEAILEFCRTYWGHPDKLKTVQTPFRTDSTYEQELASSLPASPVDLTSLETEYGSSYRSTYGSLLYFSNVTRIDLIFAMCRLGKYVSAPTTASFQGLHRICRYLATKPHRPLFYPSNPSSGTNVVVFSWSPSDVEKRSFSNELLCFNDAGDPQDLQDLRSVLCNIHTLGGTAIAWESKKSTSIPLHSTDSEIRSNSRATKRTKIFRHFLLSIGHPVDRPITIYQDNAAVAAIVRACRITPRTKYLGIHAGFCQQEQVRGNTDIQYIPTRQMLADMGTKPLPGPPLARFTAWAIGFRFYPPSDSPQFQDMDLSHFSLTYLEIISLPSSSPS